MGRSTVVDRCPYLVDQALDRHHLTRAEEENGEHRPLFGSSECEGLRSPLDFDFERPEDTELDISAFVTPV